MPVGKLYKAKSSDLPAGYQHGFFTRVPMIETPIYLPFLQKRFLDNGVMLTVCEVKNLAEIAAEADWLINCTSLAAGKLTGDKDVFPIRGQILKVDPMPGLSYLADDDGPNALAHIFPRKDCTVLGGTAQLPLVGQPMTMKARVKKILWEFCAVARTCCQPWQRR